MFEYMQKAIQLHCEKQIPKNRIKYNNMQPIYRTLISLEQLNKYLEEYRRDDNFPAQNNQIDDQNEISTTLSHYSQELQSPNNEDENEVCRIPNNNSSNLHPEKHSQRNKKQSVSFKEENRENQKNQQNLEDHLQNQYIIIVQGKKPKKNQVLIEEIPEKAVPKVQDKPSVFHALTVPKISLLKYMERILKFTVIDKEYLILGIIYVLRFLELQQEIGLNDYTIHRLIFIGTITAVKFYHDKEIENKIYAKIGGISLKDFVSIETQFLIAIKFDLVIQNQEYYTLYKKISSVDKKKKFSKIQVENSNKKEHQCLSSC